MPNESNKCNGIVTSKLMGLAIVEYGHADGTVCARPGPSDLAIGTLVGSEFRVEFGLCEHTILAVHDVATEPEEKAVTVANILGAHANVPDDEPVPQDVIARAKIPPRVKFNPSTAPARTADVPVENRYEYDLTDDDLRELDAIRGITDEPISTGGRPVS